MPQACPRPRPCEGNQHGAKAKKQSAKQRVRDRCATEVSRCAGQGLLTVKLNGRAEAPDWRRGRTISSCARGAQPPTHHGPFQRLLGDTFVSADVKNAIACGSAESKAVDRIPNERKCRKR